MRKIAGTQGPAVDERLYSVVQASVAPLREALSRLRASFSNGIKALQHARMVAVLSELTDAQLAVHNITRDEIPDYAAELIGYPRK